MGRRRAWTRGGAAVSGAVLLVSLLIAPSSALAERTIGLSAAVVDFSLAPGQSAGDSIRVVNSGDEPVKVLVYTADIVAGPDGEQEYERPDPNEPGSPASWVRLQAPADTKVYSNTTYLEMDPGEDITIDYTVAVPPGTSSGDHNAVIFFEMFDFADDTETSLSLISGRLGARLAIRVVGDVVDELDLTSLTARSFIIGDQMPYGVRVDNSASNIDKEFALKISLLGSGESEAWSEQLEPEGRVYAGQDRDFSGTATLSNVGLGRYTLRAVMDSTRESGDESITVEPLQLQVERTVWVIPLWLAIALVIVIALPLLYLSWRASNKRVKRSARLPEARGGDAAVDLAEPAEEND